MLVILLMPASSGADLILSNENTRCCHSKVRSFNGTMSSEPLCDGQSNVLRHRLVAQGGRLGAVLRGGVVKHGRVASYAEPRMVSPVFFLKLLASHAAGAQATPAMPTTTTAPATIARQ